MNILELFCRLTSGFNFIDYKLSLLLLVSNCYMILLLIDPIQAPLLPISIMVD